jgi:hypothetical protein
LGWYQTSEVLWFWSGEYLDAPAALSEFVNHSHFQDDEDQLGDKDNLAAFLEFILRQIQQVKNDASFEQSSSPPRSLKKLVDDCNENYSSDSSKVIFIWLRPSSNHVDSLTNQAHLGIDMVDEDSPWSDAFSEYISLQIQKLKSGSYDNRFKMDCDSSWVSFWIIYSIWWIMDLLYDQDPFKLDTNDLDNKHCIMLNTIIKIMLERPKHNINSFGDFSLPGYIKESTDNGDGGAKHNLFDVFGEADSIFLKGKFVRVDYKLHHQAPPNDEDHLMLDVALPEPTSQPDEQEHSTSPPSLPQAVMSPSLVHGAQRKGRRFAKEATDYLKAWLHCHSDNLYPSKDEKMQLCHATGLSWVQLSGWMVKVSHKKCLLLGIFN